VNWNDPDSPDTEVKFVVGLPSCASTKRWSESMAKAKMAAVNDISRSQAQRLLEAARVKRAGGADRSFSQAVGKATLRRNGRKTSKGGVGGGAE
jgi:hypothetical protein